MADLWGLMAEFADERALRTAADRARRAGYRRLDAHTLDDVRRIRTKWYGVIIVFI